MIWCTTLASSHIKVNLVYYLIASNLGVTGPLVNLGRPLDDSLSFQSNSKSKPLKGQIYIVIIYSSTYVFVSELTPIFGKVVD